MERHAAFAFCKVVYSGYAVDLQPHLACGSEYHGSTLPGKSGDGGGVGNTARRLGVGNEVVGNGNVSRVLGVGVVVVVDAEGGAVAVPAPPLPPAPVVGALVVVVVGALVVVLVGASAVGALVVVLA